MGITYDPMTGEPIETVDEVIEETSENLDKSSENTEISENDSLNLAGNDNDNVDSGSSNSSDNVDSDSSNSSDNVDSGSNNSNDNADSRINYNNSVIDDQMNMNDAKKGIEPRKILPFVLVIGIVIIALLICVLSGAFLSKKQKVVKAIGNTLKIQSALLDDSAKFLSILNEENFTLNYDFDADSLGKVEGSVIITSNEKQLSVDADIKGAAPFAALGQIDKDTVKVEVPKLSDYLYLYNYREDKDGYIVDAAGEKVIEQIDKSLQSIYDNKSSSKDFEKKLAKLNAEYFNKLNFESVESDTYKVDGKKVECKGYMVTIENDWIEDYFDEFSDIYLDQLEESFSGISEFGDISSIEDSFKDAKRELKNIPDIEITFYIYKNALACIHIDAGKKSDEVDILFRGGDFRAQSVIVEVDEEEVFSFKMSKKNDKETYRFKVDDSEAEIEYNSKKGNIYISVSEGRKNYEYECKLTSENGVSTLSFNDVDIAYFGTFDLEISAKKGSKLMKFENDEEFDIGNADKHDYYELMDEFDEDFTGGLSYLF